MSKFNDEYNKLMNQLDEGMLDTAVGAIKGAVKGAVQGAKEKQSNDPEYSKALNALKIYDNWVLAKEKGLNIDSEIVSKLRTIRNTYISYIREMDLKNKYPNSTNTEGEANITKYEQFLKKIQAPRY